MAKKQKSCGRVFAAGFVKENPVMRLVLGTCPTLAVSTMASNAIGMGIAATIVLIGSNAVISALRNVIPDKVRIPCFITIIAGFVTMIQMLVKAFLPSIDASLGIFLPLIVVNCIILGRAESFASKNKILPSILDGLGMGIGFMIALLIMGSIREILGAGTWFGFTLNNGEVIAPMLLLILPPGGFFVYAIIMAYTNRLSEGKGPVATQLECGRCPMAETCMKSTVREQRLAEKAEKEAKKKAALELAAKKKAEADAAKKAAEEEAAKQAQELSAAVPVGVVEETAEKANVIEGAAKAAEEKAEEVLKNE